MKKKNKSSWVELYMLVAAGCAALAIEGVLPMAHHTRQLTLMLTLAAMFWLMYQWTKASRFKTIMTSYSGGQQNRPMVTRIQTYQPAHPES